MSDVAIKVERLSKHYRLGIIGGDTLREDLNRMWARVRGEGDPLAPVSGNGRLPNEEHWALRDISFDVHKGEVLGIIGRNGAGKSTLLKILSRTTAPTTGRVRIKGRIASLLEVGTGFHPELTGRENIFLNGAILGMKNAEITRKLDDIIDFSGVDQFIDTPVKRYSSGMYVRLAFAVAAHLEPEILVVDEVLAVGDASFQKKCLGKMQSVAGEGRTVLFVSHNMAMISNLCRRGLVLHAGLVDYVGDVSNAVIHYYDSLRISGQGAQSQLRGENAELLSAELIGTNSLNEVLIFDTVKIRMRYRLLNSIDAKCVPNFQFMREEGHCAFHSNAPNVSRLPEGTYQVECELPPRLLNEGAYFVGVALTTYFENGGYHIEFHDRDAVRFNVIDPMDERSVRYGYSGPIPGAVRPELKWHIEEAA